MKTIRVKIAPLPGTSLAEDKDAAREIREKKILPALSNGQIVQLDFRDVEIATQSFIHALISLAIRRFGEEGLRRLRFTNCTSEVQQLVLTVVQYTLMAAEATDRAISDALRGDEESPAQ